MRRVLMICFDFPPAAGGSVVRSAKFARYLPEAGWGPVVLCQRPEPCSAIDPAAVGDLPSAVRVRRLTSSTPDGLAWRAHDPLSRCLGRVLPRRHARWLASLPCRGAARLLVPMYRPDSAVGFVRRALREAPELIERFAVEAIYVSSPPASLLKMGLALKRRTGLPLLCDLRDPIVGHNTFHVPPPWWRRARRRIERDVVAGCDRIISAVDTATEDLLARYPHARADRFLTIPNGYDPADFAAPSPAADGVLRIVHAGALYGARRMDGLLEAVAGQIERRGDLRGRIRIDHFGPHPPDGGTVLARRLEGVLHWHGSRPHAEVTAAMQTADVLLLMVMPDTRFSVPGKTYEYLGARRPILLLGPADSPAGRLIRRLEAGWILDADDRERLARWLTESLDRRRSGPLPAPPEADLAPWQRPAQAARLAEVLNELTRRTAPRSEPKEPAYA